MPKAKTMFVYGSDQASYYNIEIGDSDQWLFTKCKNMKILAQCVRREVREYLQEQKEGIRIVLKPPQCDIEHLTHTCIRCLTLVE